MYKITRINIILNLLDSNGGINKSQHNERHSWFNIKLIESNENFNTTNIIFY